MWPHCSKEFIMSRIHGYRLKSISFVSHLGEEQPYGCQFSLDVARMIKIS
jgi:hypothetical protein